MRVFCLSQPNDLWLQQEFESADKDNSGSISQSEFLAVAKENVKVQVRTFGLSASDWALCEQERNL
jgi:Ca2+-binding EF-hand superfamily protein